MRRRGPGSAWRPPPRPRSAGPGRTPRPAGPPSREAAVGPAVLVDEVAGRPVDVEHRGEVHVQPRLAQGRRGAGARTGGLGRRVSRLADLFLGEVRRPGKPAHDPAFLVGHEQQRRPHRVAPARVRALQPPGHRGQLGGAGDVPGEEDDPGRLAPADRPEQGPRRSQARVAVDDPLAGQLCVGQPLDGQRRRGRRRIRDMPRRGGRGRPGDG